MDTNTERTLLVGEYSSFLEIVRRKGVSFEAPPDDEVKKMSIADLQRFVHVLRDLARTPSE